jgi:DNA-directed RNA polymerase subunit N (RpoN/RPB10)
MQEQPICPECSGDLSSFYSLFQLLRTDKVRKILNDKEVDITQIDISQTEINDELDMTDVFDAMGIVRICCRGHLTAAKDFYDYYRSAK